MEFGLWTQMAYVPFAGVLEYQPGDNYVWDQTGSTEILQMQVPLVGMRKIALSHFPVAYNGTPLPKLKACAKTAMGTTASLPRGWGSGCISCNSS